MRVLKTRWFTRFARKECISDTELADAVAEIEKGLYDADLGGGLIKKRVARTGQGKRGGYRTVVAYRAGRRAVFLYGFPKKDKSNLTEIEEEEFKKIAKVILQLSEAALVNDLKIGRLKEVAYGKEKI